jgi:hypothetical protein
MLIDVQLVFIFAGGLGVGWLLCSLWAWSARQAALTERSKLGSAKQQSNNADFENEMGEAIAELVQAVNEKVPMTDAIKNVAMRHPRVALRFAKKLKIPGLEGL